MANRNSKYNRKLAHKNKVRGIKESVFDIPMTIEGSNSYTTRKQTISAVGCKRKSEKEKGKVAASKNNQGMSLMDQNKFYFGRWLKTN